VFIFYSVYSADIDQIANIKTNKSVIFSFETHTFVYFSCKADITFWIISEE